MKPLLQAFRLIADFFDFCTFKPKPTFLHFLLLLTSLFLVHQFSIFFKSLLSFSSVYEFLPDIKIVVSSARSAIFELSRTIRGRSLINKRNSNGPKNDPCGTPTLISNFFDSFNPRTTKLFSI